MIGGCRTDKDKGPGKEMARVYNGHRGIIGRARERERERKSDGQRASEETKTGLGSNRPSLPVRITVAIVHFNQVN